MPIAPVETPQNSQFPSLAETLFPGAQNLGVAPRFAATFNVLDHHHHHPATHTHSPGAKGGRGLAA